MTTTRQELLGKIQTVLGPIEPQRLGRCGGITARIDRRHVLGGLINEYRRAA